MPTRMKMFLSAVADVELLQIFFFAKSTYSLQLCGSSLPYIRTRRNIQTEYGVSSHVRWYTDMTMTIKQWVVTDMIALVCVLWMKNECYDNSIISYYYREYTEL